MALRASRARGFTSIRHTGLRGPGSAIIEAKNAGGSRFRATISTWAASMDRKENALSASAGSSARSRRSGTRVARPRSTSSRLLALQGWAKATPSKSTRRVVLSRRSKLRTSSSSACMSTAATHRHVCSRSRSVIISTTMGFSSALNCSTSAAFSASTSSSVFGGSLERKQHTPTRTMTAMQVRTTTIRAGYSSQNRAGSRTSHLLPMSSRSATHRSAALGAPNRG
mmetsp:Transcript_82692/g.221023  ORF Transcript_82692/g.221023 Transcript_82692/m.221023 type:complete len:226 (-) Transcript_82692:249-926(-)